MPAKNDVILGANGIRFTADARVQFANAITRAEAAEDALKLPRWRAGKTD